MGQLVYFSLSLSSYLRQALPSATRTGYWNKLYAYTDDDPLSDSDPYGLGPWGWFGEKGQEKAQDAAITGILASGCIAENCKRKVSHRSLLDAYGDCASLLARITKQQGAAIPGGMQALGGVNGILTECAEKCSKDSPRHVPPVSERDEIMDVAVKYLCAGAWASQLLLTTYYGIGLPKSFHIGAVDVSQEVALRQQLMYGWIGVGLALALASLWLRRWWPLTVITSSLTYLAVWYLDGPMALVGIVDGYLLMLHTAVKFGLYVSFSIRDVAVPIALMLSLVGAASRVVRSDFRQPESNS
jgi:hypothetical protein